MERGKVDEGCRTPEGFVGIAIFRPHCRNPSFARVIES
jgi:hypothetical protein